MFNLVIRLRLKAKIFLSFILKLNQDAPKRESILMHCFDLKNHKWEIVKFLYVLVIAYYYYSQPSILLLAILWNFVFVNKIKLSEFSPIQLHVKLFQFCEFLFCEFVILWIDNQKQFTYMHMIKLINSVNFDWLFYIHTTRIIYVV